MNSMPFDSQSKQKPKRFLSWSVLNRDLCQLEFFRRILDEFFMVRVSGLKEMLSIDEIGPMPGELTPVEQLDVIRKRVLPLVEEHARCLSDEVIPDLESHGVVIARYTSLSKDEKR